jgi:hypothetical protein
MRRTHLLLAAAFFAGIAMADDKPLDVTITVVDSPADLPAAVTKTIELPAPAVDQAHGYAQQGAHETANQARTLGREFGQNIADEAKTKGKGRP